MCRYSIFKIAICNYIHITYYILHFQNFQVIIEKTWYLQLALGFVSPRLFEIIIIFFEDLGLSNRNPKKKQICAVINSKLTVWINFQTFIWTMYSARHLNPTKSNSNWNLTDLVFRFFPRISTDFLGFPRIFTIFHGFPRIFSDFSRILSRSQRFSHRYSLITLFKNVRRKE